MLIVTKNTGRVIRTLSDEEVKAVINVHTGGKNATERQQKIALEVAAFAKSSAAWLQCDCNPITAPSYLFPRQTESGAITLVRPRPPRQMGHALTCPFYLSESSPLEVENADPAVSNLELHDFCLLKNEGTTNGTSTEKSGQAATSTKNLPKLTRMLFSILEGSGLNTLSDDYPFDYLKSIFRYSRTLPMWKNSPMVLADVLSTITLPGHLFSLCKRLKVENRFAEHNKRPQGYAIGIAQNFTENSIILPCGYEIKVVGAISAPNRVPKGPYWFMILVGARSAESRFFENLRATIWPAYSEKLPIPVDSDPERYTLKELISWTLYWQSKGDAYTVMKPLDFTTNVRPDFIVQDCESGNRVVIETMGSNDGAYLTRKKEMHELMSRYGHVIEHRIGDDSLAFKKSVTTAIMS